MHEPTLNRRHRFITRATVVTNIGLLLGSVLAAVMFAYFVYHYGWARDRQFNAWYYAILYYGLPLGVAILLLFSLRLPSHQKINLFVFLVASTASVYGSELLIDSMRSSQFASPLPVMTVLDRSDDKQRDAAALKRQWNVDIDTRTGTEFIAALRERSVDAVPIISPSNQLLIDQPDRSVKSAIFLDGQELVPLGAVSRRITVFCNESGQFMSYKSDDHGFNNPNDVWSSDRLAVAALGDSFAHGYCVPADRNFVALIRQRHPRTLNLGMAGYGPILALATLKEYLPRFEPRIVLWFFYEGNDLIDLERERRTALLMNYLRDGFTQPKLARQADLDRAILDQIPRLKALEETRRRIRNDNRRAAAVPDFLRLSRLRERLALVGGAGPEDTSLADPRGANINVLRQILLDAKTQTEGWGGKLIFVYLPDWTRYTRYYSGATASARAEVVKLVRGLAIPIVDINAAFQAHGDPLSLFPFRREGHYNEAGHRVVADEVLRALTDAD